jgi:hypothetical protein
LLALLSAGGYFGTGTYALLGGRATSAGNGFQAGTVRMAGTPPSGAAIFAVPALLPGDAVEQPVTVVNAGSLDFSYTMLVTAPAPSALAQDPMHGLQLEVDRCVTGGWATPTPASSNYVCLSETPAAGPTVLSIYRGPALNQVAPAPGATPSPAPVPVGTPLAAGGAHSLRLRVTLPESALDAGLIGQSAELDIRWQAEVLIGPAAPAVPGAAAQP